ncbi:AAA family ATPase [Comamonas faecalis]|uniref:AAA family ATPase n=1 Tax=Comamonas faecalis TaxID=1387849 RepID=A0ABP7RRZ8_9BURK
MTFATPPAPELDETGQQRMVQALQAWLQHDCGAPVQQVQTHLSQLLLTPAHAYKIKKAIALPFADFRSLQSRRHFCQEELRLNRRLAPQLYLDVMPVLGSESAPRLGDPDPDARADSAQAIDWVLRMRRFASDVEAAALLRANRLDGALVEDFGGAIAHFHAGVPAAAAGSRLGSAAQVRQAVDDVFATLQPLLLPAEQDWLQRLRAPFQNQAPLWERRQAQGHVREGHGDLHLGNVVQWQGALTAFDCIEFSDALRWTDTLADIGFFTMDLHAHGRADLAWRCLDAYLTVSGDYDGLAVLRPYEIYRALVRLMTQRLRTQQQAGQGAAAPVGPDYLACARQLAQPQRPCLLLMHGLSGSGKSSVAAALLAALGAVRLRSDVERKRLHGLQALDDSAAHGLDIYTAQDSERTFDRLLQLSRALLQAGYPVIVDAAFLRRGERQRFLALARELGQPHAIVHCRADLNVLRARVAQRRAQGRDASEADLQVLEQQLRRAEPLTPDERALAITVDTAQPLDVQALRSRCEALHAAQ